MGDFVNGRLDGLQFAHALLNSNPLFRQVVVAVRASGDVLKTNRDGGGLFQRLEKILVLLHAARQFLHPQRGQRLPLGLAHVKDGNNLKGRNLYLLNLGDRLSVPADHLLALGVQLRHFLFGLKRGWSQYLDGLFAFLDVAVKIIPPLVIACDKLAALHGDQERVVKAVTVELRHRGEIGFVAFTLEKFLYSCFQPVGDFFHAVGAVLAVQDNGGDGLRGRSCGLLFLLWLGFCFLPQRFRRGIAHYPVFLRHGLALVDALPLVAGSQEIAVLRKRAFFLAGDKLAQPFRVDGRFPLVGDYHQAGTV